MRLLGVVIVSLLAAQVVAQCRQGHGLTAPQLADFELKDVPAREATLEQGEKLSVREIRVFRQNVFRAPSNWLSRGANRLNTLTREPVVRAILPFVHGQKVSSVQIEEAERILRAKPFLYDARVLVRRICEGVVDLDVVVRDVWTLNPSLDFARSGGDSRTGFGLGDVNFLGLGKTLELLFRKERDQDAVTARYFDPNILGSRWSTDLSVSQLDEGERFRASLVRPFFALDTRWAGGVSVDHYERREDLEFLGRDIAEFRARTNTGRVHIAHSRGRDGSHVDRYFLGLALRRERYSFAAGPLQGARGEREYFYPYVAWQRLSDRYLERVNLFRIGVIEDIAMGWQGYLELGWSPSSSLSDGNRFIYDARVTTNWLPGKRHLLRGGAALSGRYAPGHGGTEALWYELSLSHVWQNAHRWRSISTLRFSGTRDLPLDQQLLLGGDTGLRGYPRGYQAGDHRFVASFEERYLPDWYPWRLFRVAVAAFVDAGRAWFHEDAPPYLPSRSGGHFDVLANVGLGLRIESVRTRRDRIIYLDLARPLVNGPGVGGLEFNVSVQQAL